MAKRKRTKKSPYKTQGTFGKTKRFDVDLVIPVYGKLDLLKKCVESIRVTCENVNYKLIIVDDCSPKSEKKELMQYYRELEEDNRVKVIRLTQNSGYPHAANVGVEAGNSGYAILVNSDVELKENCIQEMVATLAHKYEIPHSPIDLKPHSPIGIVGAKLIFPDDSPNKIWDGETPAGGRIQHAGMHVDIGQTPQHTYLGWSADHPSVNVLRRIQMATGALLGFNRDVWNEIKKMYHEHGDPSKGALNEMYGKGTFEDAEFCLLARNIGYSVVYCPMAVATHAVGQSVQLSIQEEDGGYDIRRNHTIFMARCSALLIWDSPIATDLPDETIREFIQGE